MTRPLVLVALLVAVSGVLSAQKSVPPPVPAAAPAAVDAAIAAMGGQARLEAITSIRTESVGHEWALEQSERPEGPWMAHYTQRTETRDAVRRRLRREIQMRDWNFAKWSPDPPFALIVSADAAARTNGQRWAPGGAGDIADAADAFDLAPERMLLTARAASDLTLAAATTLHGVPQHVVTFTLRGRPVAINLNAWTRLPTMLQIVRNDRFGIWGDVTERRWFSFWVLEKGLWYPRQTSVEWNGYPFSDTTAMTLEVDAPADDATFEIPAETRQAFEAGKARPSGLSSITLDDSKAIEHSADVVQLPGNWDVLLVRQPDGVVIFEGPISAAYSASVIESVARRFPNAPVKAVITTSDAWPHIGGIREYVARRIPIYALDLNVPILERLAKAPRTLSPDTLSAKPVAPMFKSVSDRTTIGSGDTRIELVPVRGELGERMMMAWLPGLKLLYTTDLIQRQQNGSFFMPGMLAEVVATVERENIGPIERAAGMHLRPTPWEEIVAAVKAARSAR